MYKDFQNRITALPRGNPDPRVNVFWMLLFSPFLLVLGGFVLLVLGVAGKFVLDALWKFLSGLTL